MNWHRNPATKAGVDAFEIAIQSAALLAVIGIDITHIRPMLRGLRGQDSEGRRFLLVGFLPPAIIGVLAGSWIKSTLFGIGPVIATLAIGGLLMVVIERRFRRQLLSEPSQEKRPLAAMTLRSALAFGMVFYFS
ncbi:MAG: hypothetical protein K0A93_03445 [Desulfuromonadaceae bacterium]|nr:hypothetical protein [Desulfuromonadaceae bacterium]